MVNKYVIGCFSSPMNRKVGIFPTVFTALYIVIFKYILTKYKVKKKSHFDIHSFLSTCLMPPTNKNHSFI